MKDNGFIVGKGVTGTHDGVRRVVEPAPAPDAHLILYVMPNILRQFVPAHQYCLLTSALLPLKKLDVLKACTTK